MTEGQWFAIAVAAAFLVGLRSSWRLTRRYRRSAPIIEDLNDRLVLLLLVVIAWSITAAAGYYGFLSARSILGFERLAGAAFVSVAVACLVLFIPLLIDIVVERVSKSRGRPE